MNATRTTGDRSESSRWESLHLLRAVASIAVVAHHVPQFLESRVSYPLATFEPGAAGVDIFFVISGFVMYCATARGPQRWHEFLVKRAIRVLPMYWLVTIAVTAAVWCAPSAFAHFRVTGEQLARSLLFILIYDQTGEIRPVIAVGWTLHFEILFYALVTCALPFAKTRAAIAAAAIFCATAIVCWALGLPQPFTAWQLLGPITVEFALGVLLAHALHSTRALQITTWVRVPFCCVLFTLAILGFASATPHGVGLDRLVYWGLGGCALAASFTLLEPQLRSARRFEAIYGPLGDASYSLYLVHGSVFPIIWKLLSETYRSHALLTWLTLLVVPVLVSLPIHYLVETRVTQMLNRGHRNSRRLFSPGPSPDSVQRYGS